ncbi:arylphorin subunit alpha-like [Maniola hyperantus]|uniref:arylphorin subunit alpha-like n=1 Tax=Aphantopus hyperantus TaxID=2795564 RepID=UPI0015691953|nr:arylphorin subunit alpha-like [Maniola hyperantus]
MKAVTVFLISVLCLQIQGYLIKVPTSTSNTRVATGGWVHIQKLLLPLFENVCEESTEPIIVRLNEEFKLDPSSGIYLNPEVVSNFQNLEATKGLLAKGEIFTEYNPDHLNELKVIYELLYYARDFDTFYKAACWARQNVNCGLFVDAIYLAILNRRDTEKVSIPAPYEILPNYFIRKDFVIKASSLIRGETVSLSDSVRNEGNAYVLDVNYTTSYNYDTDDKLAYFHEDIGLNSYYFLTKLNNLPWLIDSQKESYGQHVYHIMKQMMARYNLERYSNGLPELEAINWNDIGINYDPMLIYSNGNDFSQRMSANIGNSEILTSLSSIEGNLQAVVIHMYKYLQRDGGYSKSDIINQLMEILVTSERSYLNLALQFVNNDGPLSRYPSVLEHYITSVRDPLFWKLNKKIVDLVDDALTVLPSYSRNELYFPGVEVQNIEIKKMMTTFDNFKFDVTSALKTEGEVSKFEVKICQSRLNHKPFSFKISVSSLVAQKALVKIYLGPKVMPGELVENKNLFMLLDSFEVNLKIGSNVLSRASNEITNVSEEFLPLESLHKLVLDAEFGVDALPLKSVWSQIGFPSRLILPKGTSEGLPLHAFVFIGPYVKATIGGSRTNMDLNTAIISLGYPLDLNIELQQLFNLPNALVKEISIIHKSESTSYNKPANNYNSNSRGWPTDDQESDVPSGPLYLSARPEFTKRTFDYKSKNNQYGKKTDYATKRGNYNSYQSKKPTQVKIEAEDKTNVSIEPEEMEVVYNISKKIDRDRDVYKDKIIHNELDKVKDVENPFKSDSFENDFDKVIDIKNHGKKGKTEPDTMDVVNNIYISRDLEHEVPVINDEETVHNVFLYDKDHMDKILLDTKPDDNNFEKVIEIKNSNVKPHGLLTMPKRNDVLNIFLKPLKIFDSKEILYE